MEAVKMRPKAVVFDFNGVFAAQKEMGILSAVREKTGLGKWIALSNYYVNILNFERGELSPPAFWEKVFPGLTPAQCREWIEAEYEKPFSRDVEMYALAQKLSEVVPLYCLSNSNFLQGKACRKQGLYRSFKGFFLSHEIRAVKPFPAAYRHVLKAIGLRADECVFVDDSIQNVAVAALLGFRVVHFSGARELESKLKALGLPC